MSRELLKRAMRALNNTIEAWDRDAIHGKAASELIYGGDLIGLAREIETYLAQPEPEPVAWTTMPDADDWDFISGSKDPNGKMQGNWQPLYTSPPDQSARVAELEKDNAITHENLAWYITKYREHLTEIEVLKQQLTALQAKREPLSSELLTELAQQANKAINPYYEFARAIEAAHGITGEQE